MDIPSENSGDLPSQKRILTVGTFDGVHLGHQKILQQIIQVGKEQNLLSTVISFEPHPRLFFNPSDDLALLTTTKEKIDKLTEIGIKEVIIIPFDKTFSNLSPFDYLKAFIKEKFNTQILVIGYDHSFGKGRVGNESMAKEIGKELDFEVIKIGPRSFDDAIISSTKIRKAIANGNIELANNYLGYNYTLTGKIIEGQKLGRTIGFPTANILLEPNKKALPKTGVYIVKSYLNGIYFWGMMNIGYKPTVSEENKLSVEVHFLEFDKEIYDHTISIEVLYYLRNEQKFSSIEELQKQIKVDFYDTLQYIKEQEF